MRSASFTPLVGHGQQVRYGTYRTIGEHDLDVWMQVEHDLTAASARRQNPRPASPTATIRLSGRLLVLVAVASATSSAHGPR